ncbi:MAG: hypothetical protein Q4A82_00705 [Corynebacterium sp.]|nr:hypothetical protein [Corynebacterium sp.]
MHDGALVFDSAQLFGDAQVLGNAKVFGDAWVSDCVWLSGDAQESEQRTRLAQIMMKVTTHMKAMFRGVLRMGDMHKGRRKAGA